MTKDKNIPKEPSLFSAHISLWLIIALLCISFYWAAHNTISIVSHAQGEVIPESRVKQIQHLEGGIIEKIFVTEGQSVKKGQNLVSLRPTQSKADVTVLAQKMLVLSIDMTRLEAELAGQEMPDYSAKQKHESPSLVGRSRQLFIIRKQRLNDALIAQELLVDQRKQEQIEVAARLGKNKKSLSLLQEQVEISQNLIKNALSNRMQHLTLLREMTQLKGLVSEDTANIALRKASIKAAQAKSILAKSEFLEQARREYDETSRKRADLSEQLRKASDALDRTTLKAPVDGIIKSIAVTGENAVIRSGENVLEIVPTKDNLLIEAKLPTGEIGYIHKGQTTKIWLANSDAQHFGSIEGKISYISPDTHVTKDGFPFYRIKIKTQKNMFGTKDKVYRLYPGIQVNCDIISGKRTVLSYLVSPFTTLSSKALGER